PPGGGVEEFAVGDRSADRVWQSRGGGAQSETVGVNGRDERVSVDGDVDRCGRLDVGHIGDPTDPVGRIDREGGRVAGEVTPGADGEEIGAERVDLGEQSCLRRGGESEDADDRCCTDRDSQGGERGADFAGSDADAADAEHVSWAQPSWREVVVGGHAFSLGWSWMVSLTMRPSRISTRLGRRAAMARSWVMTT